MAFKDAVEVVYTLVDKTKEAFKSIGNNLDKAAQKAENVKKKLESIGQVGKVLAVGAGAIAAAFSFLGFQSLKLAGEVEQQRIAFKGLLGSYERADEVIARIRKEAARTPFDIPGLTRMTQQLTTVTKDGGRAVDILLDIGDAVAMSGKDVVEMQRVILNIQQVASTGKLTAMDIRQFQGAIPIFNDILAASGLTTTSLQESANVSELLFSAFHKAAQEGGIAFNGLANQSKSLNGLISTMKDNFGGLIRQLGDGLMPIAKPVVGFINSMLDKFQELSPRVKTFAAVIVVSTIAVAGLVTGIGLFMVMLPVLITGMATLGVTTTIALAGLPIIITGIVLGFIYLRKHIDTIKVSFQNTFDSMKIKANEWKIHFIKSIKDVLDWLNKIPGINIYYGSAIESLEEENKKLQENINLRNDKIKKIEDEAKAEAARAKKQLENDEKEKKAKEKAIVDAAKLTAAKKTLEESYLEFFKANQADQENALKIGANAYLDFEKKKYIGKIQAWMAAETAIAAGLISSIVGIPEGLLKLLGVGAAGAGVAAINAVQLAKGGAMTVSSATNLLGGRAKAGETGQKEELIVRPLRRSDSRNNDGGNTTLIVQIGSKTIAKQVLKSGYQGRTEGTINDGININ